MEDDNRVNKRNYKQGELCVEGEDRICSNAHTRRAKRERAPDTETETETEKNHLDIPPACRPRAMEFRAGYSSIIPARIPRHSMPTTATATPLRNVKTPFPLALLGIGAMTRSSTCSGSV